MYRLITILFYVTLSSLFICAISTPTEYEVAAFGDFHRYGCPNCRGDARWNGTQWLCDTGWLETQIYTIHAYVSTYGATKEGLLYASGYANTYLMNGPGGARYLAQRTMDAMVPVPYNTSQLYFGGYFTYFAGVSNLGSICKFDGQKCYDVFQGGISLGGEKVLSIAAHGSNVYVGGDFMLAGASTVAKNLAWWDGSSWHAMGAGCDSAIEKNAIVVNSSSDGSVYINCDGKLNKWDGNTLQIMPGSFSKYGVLGSYDGDLYVSPYSIPGFGNGLLAKWNGVAWTSLATPSYDRITTMHIESATSIFAAGRADSSNNFIFHWTPDNGAQTIGGGIGNRLHAIYKLGNEVWVGGPKVYGGLPTQGYAIRASHSDKWTTYGHIPASTISIYDMVANGTTIYAIDQSLNLLRGNGTSWSHVTQAPLSCSSYLRLAVSGSDIFVTSGGCFCHFSATGVLLYSKVENSGTIYAITAGVDGSVYITGSFTSYASVADTSGVARYNVQTNQWSSVGGTGLVRSSSPTGYSLAVNGSILCVGGNFNAAFGVTTSDSMACMNLTSGTWRSLSTLYDDEEERIVRGIAMDDNLIYAFYEKKKNALSVFRVTSFNGTSWNLLHSYPAYSVETLDTWVSHGMVLTNNHLIIASSPTVTIIDLEHDNQLTEYGYFGEKVYGVATIVKCSPGYYRDSTTGECSKCTAGTYTDKTEMTVCTPCPGATFSLPGSSSCPLNRSPILTTLSPKCGPSTGGTTVQLSGYMLDELTGGNVNVHINSTTAMSHQVTATSILVNTPVFSDTGLTHVSVVGAQLPDPTQLQYLVYTVDTSSWTFTPKGAPVSTQVTVVIQGTSVDACQQQAWCRFGVHLVAGTVNAADSTIKCLTPTGVPVDNSAMLDVTYNGQQFHQIGSFPLYDINNPVLSPLCGTQSGGTNVVINGTGIVCMDSYPLVKVHSDTVADAKAMVNGTCINKAVHFVMPSMSGHALAIPHTMQVSMSLNGLVNTLESVGTFTMIGTVSMSPNGIQPAGGPADSATNVTIAGNNFATTCLLLVRIEISGQPTQIISGTYVTSMSLKASLPALIDGNAASASLSVSLDGDYYTSTQPFSYFQVSSVSPSLSPTAGGIVVTVTGSGFLSTGSSLKCRFGSEISPAMYYSETEVRCTTPSIGSPGTVAVEVTCDGEHYTSSGRASLLYYAVPVVTSVSPSGVYDDGGTEVTLTGGPFINNTITTVAIVDKSSSTVLQTSTDVRYVSSTTIVFKTVSMDETLPRETYPRVRLSGTETGQSTGTAVLTYYESGMLCV